MRTILVGGWAHDGGSMAVLTPAGGGLALGLGELVERAAAAGEAGSGVSRWAAGLLARLAALPAPIELVGWSTGAMVALEALASGWPAAAKVVRLALLAGTPRFVAGADWAAGVPEANLRALAAGLRRAPEATLDGFLRLAAAPGECSATVLAARRTVALRQGTAELAAQLAYLRQADWRPLVGRIKLPCLVVHGAADAVISWRAGQWLAEQLPSSRWVLLPGCGHDLAQEQAALGPVRQALAAWREETGP